MGRVADIERAIHTFENNFKQTCKCENSECLEDCEMCDDTKEIILQALQEKLEREKGCEYCKGFYLENASGRKFYKAFPHTSDYWTTLDDITVVMVHDKDGYFLHFENESGERMFDVKISDCPMCGRKL